MLTAVFETKTQEAEGNALKTTAIMFGRRLCYFLQHAFMIAISSMNDEDRNPPINNSLREDRNAPINANQGAIYTVTQSVDTIA